jgi:hypothetical protein
LINCFISLFLTSFIVLYAGMNKDERVYVINKAYLYMKSYLLFN